MGSHGIKDQVAIIGMGCTPFTEHWDKSLDDLIIDAAQLTYASAGIHQGDIDAFWFGTSQSAASGLAMGGPLKIHGKPITRVENYCTTGSEAMRAAAEAKRREQEERARKIAAEEAQKREEEETAARMAEERARQAAERERARAARERAAAAADFAAAAQEDAVRDADARAAQTASLEREKQQV